MFEEKIEFVDGQSFRVRVQHISRYPIHWHDGVAEIILPIRGDVEVVSNFEHIQIAEGDFHFINNRSIHSIRCKAGATVVLIHVDLPQYERQFEYIRYMFFRSSCYIDVRRQADEELSKDKIDEKVRFRNLLIDILLRKLSYELSGSTLENLANRLVYSMIFEFNWLGFFKANAGMMNSAQLDRYHRIVKYIDDHYREKITLDDIVASEYITKTYFSHFWKKLSTYSFTERVNFERVLRSEFLLLENRNILKISELCGFSDVKYYYQNFKRWYGCLPSEHRLRCQNYIGLGPTYSELKLADVRSELEDYTNKYLFIECNPNDGITESAYIDNYMKMKQLSKRDNPVTYSRKFITLDPFQSGHFMLDESGAFVFNWHAIDLPVHVSLDTDFLLSICFHIDAIGQRLGYSAIERFLEGCIDRYGQDTMRKWHFLIHYRNIQSFDKSISIEALISRTVKSAEIVHNFEF